MRLHLCIALLSATFIGSVISRAAAPDWLIDPSPYKARVTEDKAAKQLILENGVARRVIQLSPNAATIDLQNLTSGEHLLRAISPEATVTLDGTLYKIGGLEGQKIQAYVKQEWLKDLHDNPTSYHYAGWSEGLIEARMAWKPRPEWMSRDLPWPPVGRQVVLRFTPPLVSSKPSGPLLQEDKFLGPLPSYWTVLKHPGLDRASFINEGKTGEIMAFTAGAVSAERTWYPGATIAEVSVESGTDPANAWGVGLALMIDGKAVPFVVQATAGTFLFNGASTGHFNRELPCTLRVELVDGKAVCTASQDGKTWQAIGSIPCPNPPAALRVGKVGIDGSGQDTGGDHTVIRCHVLNVAWHGSAPAGSESMTARTDLPEIDVHYDIYDGIPLFSKWLVVKNTSDKKIRVNRFVCEEIRFAEPEISTDVAPTHEYPNLWVETDYSFGTSMSPYYDNKGATIIPDPEYRNQVNYRLQTPCLVRCQPPEMGPDVDVAAGESFESFRAFDLLLDSTERERRTLAQRRMYRVIAPWTAENPLMFHLAKAEPEAVRNAIQQAHDVGFEMIIMSFGSGFDPEHREPAYLETYKKLAAEAQKQGIALGGYTLLAGRSAPDPKENTQGVKAMFGNMPCLGSKWGQWYLGQMRHFFGDADLGVMEMDGGYPGDRCDATYHPGHHGLEDSQWEQWKGITDLFKWCCSAGIYLNVPDWYFLSGTNKCGMHYREANWSLPRAEQELIERQNIYDGTWNKTASMGWMFVPLTEYQGGGEAATIEPLKDHLPHYERRFANLLGAGVQACWRGPRLYDTDDTKALVIKWVTFYKTHRQVLDGDIIHLRRANGLDWDGFLHVNPQGAEKGLLMLYNPLTTDIKETLDIPLYYTGLTTTAQVSEQDGQTVPYKLDRQGHLALPVTIPAQGFTWFVIK
jgi:hypothetical protein